MSEIKNDYIERALNELIPILGIREFVDHEKLYPLVRSGRLKDCVKQIAVYLGLPIEVNIYSVAKGYRPGANDTFQSTHIVKTNDRGEGIGGITAQVSIPSNLPLYGSAGMINFPINIRVSENCAENPASFIAITAHELSHILLHSILHREKENEFYTDLTAMILGFAKVMKIGRVVTNTTEQKQEYIFHSTTTTTTETSTYGYLSGENFYFAFDKIEDYLRTYIPIKQGLFEKSLRTKKFLKKTQKLTDCFKNYLKYLDANHNPKISKRDLHKISSFHQVGYLDDFETSIKKNSMIIEEVLGFATNLKKYTEQSISRMNHDEFLLEKVDEELEQQYSLLNKDVAVLRKYVRFFYRLEFEHGTIWKILRRVLRIDSK